MVMDDLDYKIVDGICWTLIAVFVAVIAIIIF